MSHNGSDIAAPAMAIAYHSGFGHTAVLAKPWPPVPARPAPTSADRRRSDDRRGLGPARRRGRHCVRQCDVHGQRVCPLSNVRRKDRQALSQRQLAGQGSGGLHKLRLQERRQGKHPGALAIFAAQHHMHWISLGLGLAGTAPPAARTTSTASVSGWERAATDVDAKPEQVHPSDVQTCRHLGWRVALVTRQLNIGRSATAAASSPAATSAPTR